MAKHKRTIPSAKLPKTIEITSLAASFISSEKKVGDEFSIVEFADAIELSNGSHPHLDTVEKKFREWNIVKNHMPELAFIENPKNGKIHRMRILEQQDMAFKKEFRTNYANLMNRMESIEAKLDLFFKKQAEILKITQTYIKDA